MIRQKYRCTLLSDIVITATAATEGFNPTLDYIPGAKFLGIAASSKDKDKLYDTKMEKQTLDLFHNGTIHFGDAHLVIEGKRGHMVPASWFHMKGEESKNNIWVHHYLNQEILRSTPLEGEQLKQSRNGFFVERPDNENIIKKSIKKHFSIKSSHSRTDRKSKDSQMYGYHALEKGTIWEFHVEIENKAYAETIRNILQKKARIGRSRSAEYGLVQIEFMAEENMAKENIHAKKLDIAMPFKEDKNFKLIKEEKEIVVVYASSNLCFYDELGRNTLCPSASQLGINIKNANVLWEQSQIQSRLYQTWNQYRFNRDSDRMIIKKGSVFLVEVPKGTGEITVPHHVGSHYQEGFGKVHYNPTFLEAGKNAMLNATIEKQEKRKEISKDQPLRPRVYHVNGKSNNHKEILAAIRNRKTKKDEEFNIDKVVNDFKEKHLANGTFSGISSSQWGVLRNCARLSNNEETFKTLVFYQEKEENKQGFVFRGRSADSWKKKKRAEILEKFLFGEDGTHAKVPNELVTQLAVKLCSEMAKYAKQ